VTSSTVGGAVLQVIVDAGPEGDVLSPDGVATLVEVEQALLAELDDVVRRDEAGDPRVLSPTAAVVAVLEAEGSSLAEVDAAQVGAAGSRVMEAQPQLAGLFSADRDVDEGRARAATVLAQLDPDLDTGQRVAAAERLQERLGIEEGELTGDRDGFTVAVSSPELTNQALQDETQSEAPLLLLLALLAVVGVLALLLRSVFDVLVGLAGLAATLAWTFGTIALLGPDVLDWLGPLSQVGVVVPVLVVGLGIDYAVHLTARYREQRATGQAPDVAAATAVRTVGTALVLATVATAAGFAVTGLAPLSVIADFGIFTAIGVVAAFVVMGSLVPAARVLRDRRRTTSAGAVRDLDVGRVLAAPLRLAVHHPVLTLAVGALLAAGSLWAASDLDTSFDRDDFVPEDTAIGDLHTLQQELFDGELTEATYVLVDGDLADPDMLDALRDAHQQIGDVEHVRTDADGRPQVTSLVTLLDQLPDEIQQAPDLDERYRQLADHAGHDLGRLLRPDRRAAIVELRTNGGDGAAPRLAEQLHDAFAPVREVGGTTLVTSDTLVIAEMADDLRDFQLRSIAITLLVVLGLLAGYYGLAHRRPVLGAIAMIPSVTSAALLLGTMGLLGISFDAMTATLTAIAVGVGVPYGVHVTNRFEEDLARCDDADEACRTTLRTTGGALVGSALTTFAAFAVLSFSGLALIGRMGLLGAAGITFACWQPSCSSPLRCCSGPAASWAAADRPAAPATPAFPTPSTPCRHPRQLVSTSWPTSPTVRPTPESSPPTTIAGARLASAPHLAHQQVRPRLVPAGDLLGAVDHGERGGRRPDTEPAPGLGLPAGRAVVHPRQVDQGRVLAPDQVGERPPGQVGGAHALADVAPGPGGPGAPVVADRRKPVPGCGEHAAPPVGDPHALEDGNRLGSVRWRRSCTRARAKRAWSTRPR
jgi:uncharacterized protein